MESESEENSCTVHEYQQDFLNASLSEGDRLLSPSWFLSLLFLVQVSGSWHKDVLVPQYGSQFDA